jgi:hemerythrin-like domain-containing protein
MGGSQTFDRLTRHALEEHRQIHFYLDQIAQSLAGLKEGTAGVEPMRRLAAEIQSLKERLQEHHTNEESGGLFQAILEVLPARRVEIDRLTNQHGKMIEILEMARIHAQRGEEGEAESLRVDLEGFLEMFRRHEQAEERLLAQAIGEEQATTEEG